MVTRQAHIRNPIAYYRKALRNMEIDEIRRQNTKQGQFEQSIQLSGDTQDIDDLASQRATETMFGSRTHNELLSLYYENCPESEQ